MYSSIKLGGRYRYKHTYEGSPIHKKHYTAHHYKLNKNRSRLTSDYAAISHHTGDFDDKEFGISKMVFNIHDDSEFDEWKDCNGK